jgi:HK97 family phage major capsid protein
LIIRLIAAAENLMTSFEEFKARHDKRLDALEQHVVRQNRRDVLGGVGDPVNGDLGRERAAIGQFVKGDDRELKSVSGHEVGEDLAGGYLVLPQMSSSMTKRIFDLSPIRRLSRVVTLDAAGSWQEPLDDQSSSAEWVGERQARPVLDGAELALLTIHLCELYGNTRITQKLLDLSFVDLGLWIEGKLADRFARAESLAYVSGTGVGQPEGFLNLATSTDPDATRARNTLQYVPSGGASSITADGLRNLYWTMRAPHRSNAVWLMASATANSIDLLKLGSGEYLWRPSMSTTEPPSLLGRPVFFDENMPAVSGGNYPIALADLQRGYTIVYRLGMRFLRDPFSDKPHVHVYCYRRTGGAVALTDAIKLMKIGTS